MVQIKNIAQLVTWIRNEDDLIETWSTKFDADIAAQLNMLPNIANETEVPRLEEALTRSDFMTRLKTTLFEDPSARPATDDPNAEEDENVKKVGPGILELAYMVKTSEESSKDCDDAEKILRVAYNVFMQFCTFRAKPELNPERFIQVYRQQIGRVFLGLSRSRIFQNEAGDKRMYFNQFVSWLNYAGTFRNIPLASAINEKGEICVNATFNYEEYPEIAQVLNRGKGRGVRAKTAQKRSADEGEADSSVNEEEVDE